jgi:hypothetical protein
MRKALLRVSLAGAIACAILAPALIWSGQRPPTGIDERSVFKGPPVFTVGPPMTPGELAARELEKRLSIFEGQTWTNEYPAGVERPRARPSDVPPEITSLPTTDHPGLTPAELEKLAAIRSGCFGPRDKENQGTWGPKPELQVPRYDAPLRSLGSEGLTPEEKAKLEASRARERRANGDEGGRSR